MAGANEQMLQPAEQPALRSASAACVCRPACMLKGKLLVPSLSASLFLVTASRRQRHSKVFCTRPAQLQLAAMHEISELAAPTAPNVVRDAASLITLPHHEQLHCASHSTAQPFVLISQPAVVSFDSSSWASAKRPHTLTASANHCALSC